MKAKEYAKKFNEGEMSVVEIYKDFKKTYIESLEIRHAIKVEGIMAIIKELNEKWNAMTKHTNGIIAENGFVLGLVSNMPKLLTLFIIEFPEVDFSIIRKEEANGK